MGIFFTKKEVLVIDEHQGGIVIFDFMLDSIQKPFHSLLTRRKHKGLDVTFSTQSCFDLPKGLLVNMSNVTFSHTQFSKDVENFYEYIAGFDISYEE